MSTKLPTSVPAQVPPLTVLLEAVSRSVIRRLAEQLQTKGHDLITEPHLVLLGNLDCGSTHAAQIAQRMGISRQAVSKTLREMQSMGYLSLEDDPARGNQKLVVMTERGRQLAITAREELGSIEAALSKQIGAREMVALRLGLEQIWFQAI